MPRYVLDIRFKGTGYSGWQSQPNATTIQGEVDKALSTLLRTPVMTYGAGRTDAGVHALQLPAHFQLEEDLHPRFHNAINSLLPRQISVMKIYRGASDNFHARFDARERAYRYQIIFRKDPLLYQQAWWCKENLNVEAMKEAAAVIPEFKSFESFCKSNADNSTFLCDILESRFEWEGAVLVYHVRANRFLRGMVRAIVGTLAEVGLGKRDVAGMRTLLKARDRTLAGPSAIADGLFLSEVKYETAALEEISF